MTENEIQRAKEGIVLKDGTVCKGAEIKCIEDGLSTITIREGMYHQVKRMFAALGCHVLELKRLSVGSLELGDLETGSVRELTQEEIALLED